MTQAFADELRALQESAGRARDDVSGLERSLAGGFRRAIDGVVLDGQRASEALGAIARSVANAAYGAATRPIGQALGGTLASGVTAFAQGGVVAGATAFPVRGGLGVMGEAGPEAILPLARSGDGRLGVQGGGGTRVTINVTTPDAEGFRRSRSQIAAEMSRALARGERNR